MSSYSKSLLPLIISLALSGPALASITPTEGNVAQKKCGANRFDSLQQMGTLVFGSTDLKVVNRRQNVGKPLSNGEVVFYASLTEARKVYRTPKQIEIIDGSPLTPNLRITPETDLPVAATFTAKNGRRFDLVRVGAGYNRFLAMIDDTGFMCSDRVDDSTFKAVGMPTVYQELPLTAGSADAGLTQPRTHAVAVTFMGLTGASVTLEVSVMLNGVVQAKRVASFDAFSPTVQIGDLNLAINTSGTNLTVTSLTEPTDYVRFLGEIRASAGR